MLSGLFAGRLVEPDDGAPEHQGEQRHGRRQEQAQQQTQAYPGFQPQGGGGGRKPQADKIEG